jgi:hypothetical protein
MQKYFFLIIFVPLLLQADDFSTLIDYMTGSFSSAAQAKTDSDFYDIRLEMVRIWPENDEGAWLYVEQAVATHLDKPYRQRIYHVTQISENEFESAIFTFDEPLKVAGFWKTPDQFEELSFDDLTEREGCSVFLKKQADGSYAGSTNERDCLSTHRGASYATSIVTIKKNRLVSWDQGFDENGQQIWGAVKGGYIFDKIERDSK